MSTLILGCLSWLRHGASHPQHRPQPYGAIALWQLQSWPPILQSVLWHLQCTPRRADYSDGNTEIKGRRTQLSAGYGSHINLPQRPLPNPTEKWGTWGSVCKNYADKNGFLTSFSVIWWFPSWAPQSKQTWMVVISEAAHTLCDLASSLELCFATSPRNYIRKPHIPCDVTQYLRRVIIV